MSPNSHYTTVLSIAGSDSSGGAGIQADIKTCHALGVYAMTAITAVTAQNTCGVQAVEVIPPEMLKKQIEAVVTDIRPDAVKIGMVPTVESAGVICECIEHYGLTNVVLDPVMVATSGDRLSGSEVMSEFKRCLNYKAALLTPNLPEAEALSGIDFSVAKNPVELILPLAKALDCSAVLLKGGHTECDNLTDVLLADGKISTFTHPRIDTPNTHGTGCSLSSAIAAYLAKGFSVTEACGMAIEWLSRAIEQGSHYSIGHGHGPVCHFTTPSEPLNSKL